MNKTLADLALKKELLQARSALYRLQIRRELDSVSGTLSWVQAGTKLAASLPVRSGFYSLALQALGQGRVARLLRFASRVIFFAKLTNIALAMLRKSAAKPPH